MNGLLTFGEALGLVSTTEIGTLDIARHGVIGIGGAETNLAVGAARLGVPVTWIGRVGADALGDLVRKRLADEGVDVHAVIDDSYTGVMLRHRRTAGVTHVDYHRRGSAGSRLTPEDIPVQTLERAGVVHCTGITMALSASAAAAVEHAIESARAAHVPVSFDVNYRRKLWTVDDARRALLPVVAKVDVLFAGVEEAQLLAGSDATEAAELAKRLADLGPAEVLVKHGADGCTAVIDGQIHVCAGMAVPVVDPVGAGDAFVAGYLAERLAGAAIERRLELAVATGAYAVSVPGDCELSPTRRELEEMLAATDVVR
jgi:2-dehydro-3-deoxygluconokinase